MQRWPAYHRLQSHHFCEYKMLRHVWSSSWVQGSTSLHVFSNCIGCLSAGASSSSCVVLCIQFSTETVRRIYQTPFRQWVPVDRIFTYDHRHRLTTCYRDFAPSSASVPFFTLVRPHGTDSPKTFALSPSSPTFENFLKLTILILCLTFNNCILYICIYIYIITRIN